ncbi:MAG: competence protein CoiA family protein [Marinobacter sp.]|nr:competence protein CoiA family protein [Marinobacter sp.]
MSVDLAPKHLRLPYALTDLEELVSASAAVRGDRFFCPNCDDEVTLRQGDVRVAHFAHRSGTSCNPESAIHKIAKWLIVEAITKNARSDQQTLSVERQCEHCDKPTAQDLPPGTFSAAREEEWVGSYKVDVVGFRGATKALGVEVRHTHPVGEEKAEQLNIPWIELDALSVIENPSRWIAVASRMKTALCPPCKSIVKSKQQLLKRWNIRPDITSVVFNPDRAPFIASSDICWKCKTEVPVFWWNGVPFAESQPPTPRPPTIQYRYSKQYGGEYWVNTCAKCRSTLGDNFVFLFANAPLNHAHLPLRRTKEMGGTVTVQTGPGAVNAFMSTVLGKYR